MTLSRFFGPRLFRLELGEFLSRPAANRVHYVDLVQADVPLHVQNLLSKSLKFVPSTRPEPLGKFLEGADSLVRSAAWDATLGYKPPRSHISRFHIPSGAWPQLASSTAQAFATTRAVVRDAFVQIWKGSQLKFEGSNISSLDKQALAWLQSSHSVRALDTDKNLGVAVCSTSWVLSQVQSHLCKSFESISDKEAEELVQARLHSLQRIVDNMLETGLVDGKTARFLLSNISAGSYPNFRNTRISELLLKCIKSRSPLGL